MIKLVRNRRVATHRAGGFPDRVESAGPMGVTGGNDSTEMMLLLRTSRAPTAHGVPSDVDRRAQMKAYEAARGCQRQGIHQHTEPAHVERLSVE